MTYKSHKYTSKCQQTDTAWVFFATQAKPSSARRALAYRLAEISPVIVVHQPVSFLRSGGLVGTLASRTLQDISLCTCYEYLPIHYPERLPLLGKWIKELTARKLTSEIDTLLAPFQSLQRIVCYDSPGQYALVGRLKASLSVYLAIDDRTVTVKGEPIPGEVDKERKLLQRVDRVACVSDVLARTLRARTSRSDLSIDVLSNGYDERLFNPEREWKEPEQLRQVRRPRILVPGHVSERIDWEGIRTAAKMRPAWSWVFLGPADRGMAAHIESIGTESGATIKLNPPVPINEVPAWIAHSDACAVPYRLNTFTLASSPLKAIECLGSGAPLLSTRIPSLECFGELISWVVEADGASYAGALDELARQERFGARTKKHQIAVQSYNWSAQTQRFRDILGLEAILKS